MTVLVTGGAGYIGSHTVLELLEKNHSVIVIDNLSNSSEKALERIEHLTGKTIKFYENDVRDKKALSTIFKENKIDAVIHFAGLKAVGESVAKPIEYYDNNLISTLHLIEVMKENNCKNLIFSSSATVYSSDNEMPLNERSRVGNCSNPYGWTKYMIEEILKGLSFSDNDWNIVLLRYFNPVGAHKSGLIGEDPNGIPANLMPYITKVALGKLPFLNVFGDDYPTKDGTGVRDYIHVVDLAKGHISALEYMENNKGLGIFNLGTGEGYSVLDIVKTFEKENGVDVPYKIAPRRPGDLATVYSDPKKAEDVLKWKTKYNLSDMVRDSWNWQKKNPNGYKAEDKHQA